MTAPAPPSPTEIDGDDRLNARRLAAARVLFALVEAMKKELGDQVTFYQVTFYYESYLALGLGKALLELVEGDMVPQYRERLNAELPTMVEELFQRAEAVIEAADGSLQS